MVASLPLPGTTSKLVGDVPFSCRHPGLQLDKFIRPAPSQQEQKQSLAEVCQAAGDGACLKSVLSRRETYLDGVGAGTLALHHHGAPDVAPGPRVGPGERRHLPAPPLWFRLFAGDRPEGDGPRLRRNSLAAHAIPGRRRRKAGRRRAGKSRRGLADDRGGVRLGPALGRRQDVETAGPGEARRRRRGRRGQHRFSRGLAGNLAPARTGHRQQPPCGLLSRQ